MSYFNLTIDDITFKAACKNKTSAQKRIYELFSKPVYNLVFRITHNKHDALDISQDVFVKVFTKFSQNKSQELLGYWIRKISINTTLTFIKKNSHLITNVDFKEKIIDTDINETMSSLEFALSKLPAVSRSVLWMYEVEGMSHQEIADLHGKTISYSKTHLSRAKQIAQKYLTQKGGGYEAVK
ncbi:MAG: sigma-70 family RNA polymerase sigma factor [Alcanivoracaceae bacterium]|nr:sigma-70 family RNA polymerase sigma factor [Alcanivoracaceae bacterium]